jgi:hypothetical protein
MSIRSTPVKLLFMGRMQGENDAIKVVVCGLVEEC